MAIIDPFELQTPTPPPRDTLPDMLPSALNAYENLETQILQLEANFEELEEKIRLTRDVLTGISSAAVELALLHRKDCV